MEFRCQALLFDLDGVLVDSRAVVERTWRRWATERHPIDVAKVMHIAHGRRARDTLRILAPEFANDEEVAWLDATELVDVEGLRVIPGARELVTSLPRDRWAIVTSCGRDLARLRLASVGVLTLDVMVVAEDAKRGKPAPDGYLLGAKRLSVTAAECIVFEDAPAGVAAGKAAGAKVLAVRTNYDIEHLAEADATIADLRSIQVRRDRDGLVVRIFDPHE
jgi:mannitol-1-/sugar-/sorbitol-6-phosphatase